MAGRSIKEDNLKKYRSLYRDQNLRRAYEIRDKVLIFNSLIRILGEIKGKRILEIGFGTGDILLSLAKRKADCYGIEIAGSAIDYLKSISLCKLHLFKRKDNRLPFKSDFFDIIVCSHVLEHLEDDKRELGEISRVLRMNGLAVLGVPGKGVGHNLLHYREYTVDSLVKLIEDWKIIFLEKYGSGLFQKIIRLVRKIASLISGDFIKIDSIQEKKEGCGRVSLISNIYYNIGVPLLLFLLFLDNHLPFPKSNPIEIWTVLRKTK